MNNTTGRRAPKRQRLRAFARLVVVLVCVAGVTGFRVIRASATAPGVYGWGNNQTGELADGTTTNRLVPVPARGLAESTLLAIGAVHGLAMLSDGSVVAWGHNRSGQLGDGSTSDAVTPVRVAGLSSVWALAAGNAFSVAVRGDGAVVAWGHNRSGELGDGTAPTDHHTAVAVRGLGPGSTVVAVSAGDSHALALKADGTVLAWGNGTSGELGDGKNDKRSVPVQVTGLGPGSGVVKVAAGGAHSLALKADGTVLAWGNNQSGELGDGTAPVDHAIPVVVRGLGPGSGVVAIAAGFADSYALMRDGTIVAWGNNQKGETGSGDAPIDHATPVAVKGATGIVSIAAGWSHALAVNGDGTVLAWGDNALGQIGDGTTKPRSAPVQVSGFGPGSHVIAVFAGGDHSHALVGIPQPTNAGTPGTFGPSVGGPSGGGPGAGPIGSANAGRVGSARAAAQRRSRQQGERSRRGAQLYALFSAQATGGGNPYGAPPATPSQRRDEARAALAMRKLAAPFPRTGRTHG